MNAPAGSGRRRRIVNRLVVATLAAGLVAGLLGGYLLQRSAGASALADARERSQLLAEQYAVRLDAGVTDLLDDLRLMSTRRAISALSEASGPELAVVLRASRVFDELALYDLDGRPRAAAAARFLATPSNMEARPDLAEALRGGDVIAIVDGPMLELAVSVEDPPGTSVGGLVARAPLEAVSAIFEEARSASEPVPFLVDEEGKVLVHRDRSQVVSSQTIPLDVVRAADAGGRSIDRQGERRVVAAKGSELLPATVVVEQSEELALAPVAERRRELTVILGMSLLATLAAVIIAGELLLRPLRPLTSAVARVGRGDLGVRTGVVGYGEIGALAGEVDRMAEALDQRDEQLSELRELSLLVGSLALRADVVGRLVNGAMRLVHADGTALFPGAGPDLSAAEVTVGALPELGHIEDAARTAIRTGQPSRKELSGGGGHLLCIALRDADDELLGVLAVHRLAAPFLDDDTRLLAAFTSFAAVAIDNARRLDLQHALVDQLQEAVDRRRDLIGTITHEFRTPLACIDGFSTALVDGWAGYADEERLQLVERIGRHAEEMDELVSRFLDFTVTERGSLVAQLEAVEIRPAVEQVTDTLSPLLAERRLDIRLPEVAVRADPTLLRRALTNLLSNAVKYSTPGSTITITGQADEHRARLDITDEGAGLTAQEAAQAFEPFWRGGTATTRGTRGAGLGLALVAEYTRAMEGSCGVTSDPGHGSTFFITLPVATIGPPVDGGTAP